MPIITTSLSMKTLNVSSETTKTGIRDNIRVAASIDNTWTNKTTITGDKPSARYYHSMAYDSANDRTILFGGVSTVYCGDTWVYNYADNSWTNITTAGDKPSSGYGHSMAYDSAHNRIILFSGLSASGASGDTWVYCFAGISSPPLHSAAGDDDGDDDDTGIVVIIIIACVGGVVVVVIVLIKKGIIGTNRG